MWRWIAVLRTLAVGPEEPLVLRRPGIGAHDLSLICVLKSFLVFVASDTTTTFTSIGTSCCRTTWPRGCPRAGYWRSTSGDPSGCSSPGAGSITPFTDPSRTSCSFVDKRATAPPRPCPFPDTINGGTRLPGPYCRNSSQHELNPSTILSVRDTRDFVASPPCKSSIVCRLEL